MMIDIEYIDRYKTLVLTGIDKGGNHFGIEHRILDTIEDSVQIENIKKQFLQLENTITKQKHKK